MCADHVVSEERTLNTELAPVASLQNEELLVSNTVAGIPEQFKEPVNMLVLEMLAMNQTGLNTSLSAALKTLVVHTVQKVVNSTKFINLLSEGVIDSPGFTAPIAALVKP